MIDDYTEIRTSRTSHWLVPEEKDCRVHILQYVAKPASLGPLEHTLLILDSFTMNLCESALGDLPPKDSVILNSVHRTLMPTHTGLRAHTSKFAQRGFWNHPVVTVRA